MDQDKSEKHQRNIYGAMEANRMEAFSDGVIAIIITIIMVLDLRLPHDKSVAALLAMWPVFLAYALSFTLVATYWINHHHLLHAARQISAATLWLNMNWLFWLSLFPFATLYLGRMGKTTFPIVTYAVLSIIVAFAFLLLTRNLTMRNKHVEMVAALSRRRQIKNVAALAAMILAIPLAFIWKPLAIILFAVPVLSYLLPD